MKQSIQQYLSVVFCTFFFWSTPIVAQEYVKPNAIDSLYKIYFSRTDSSEIGNFQNFALKLFLEGKDLHESFFKTHEKRLIGVCLMDELEGAEQAKISFNLNTLEYRDNREEDFHKRIYDPGMEGMTGFYVICNSDEERKIVKDAVDAYLVKDSIPKTNLAYQFCKAHEIPEDEFKQVYRSNENQNFILGIAGGYLRINGNFIIQIEHYPMDVTYTEELVTSEEYMKNWFSISVFIIDEHSGVAYGQALK